MSPVDRFMIPVKDRVHLVREEIMGYAESTTCCATSVNDQIGFALFLAVRPSLRKALPF